MSEFLVSPRDAANDNVGTPTHGDGLIDDSALSLSRREKWVLGQVRSGGTLGFVMSMTAVSVAASLLLALLAMATLVSPEPGFVTPALLMSTIIPAVVAPPVLLFSVGLVDRLDKASRLLRQAALTDSLTGVLNRRGLFDELHSISRSDVAVDVAMVDLDNFKALNDQYGHAVGDLALCDVAQWLIERAGPDGTVARIGGDEFALIAIVDDSSSLPARQRFSRDGADYSITIGRAVCPPGGDLEAAIVSADKDLYSRKDNS